MRELLPKQISSAHNIEYSKNMEVEVKKSNALAPRQEAPTLAPTGRPFFQHSPCSPLARRSKVACTPKTMLQYGRQTQMPHRLVSPLSKNNIWRIPSSSHSCRAARICSLLARR